MSRGQPLRRFGYFCVFGSCGEKGEQMKTVEQLIGQMMIVGWHSADVNEIIDNIKTYNFGNVILYRRNFRSAAELRETCARIQEAAQKYNGSPAFICIDQEGGPAGIIRDNLTPVPGNMAIAAASAKCRNSAGLIGRIVGQELKSLGINCDLGPVVDVNTNPYNPIIGIRSFSDNPALVAQLASEYATNMQEQGVMACYKHFPGHGDVDVDSGLDLPRLRKQHSELDMCELVPYKSAHIADAVMTAHILYVDLDDKFPASISATIQKGLLREKLGYRGLIISDSIEMGGLSRAFSIGEAAVYAVNATTDLVNVAYTLSKQVAVRNALLVAVRDGVIDMQTIMDANARIAAAKQKYCTAVAPEIDSVRNQTTAERISEHSIALISGQPFRVDRDTVVIGVTNTAASVSAAEQVDAARYTSERIDIARIVGEEFEIPYHSIDSKNFNVSEVLEFAKGHKVILCLVDSHLMLIQKVLYSSLLQAKARVMLVSMRSPYDALNQTPPECHFATFEYSPLSCRALLKVLKGAEAAGVCPVKLDKSPHQDKSDDSRNYLVENIVEFIRENYAKHLTLDSVAEEFYISGGHLCKLVKRKMNKNFIDVVNEIRVGEAKKLLTTSTMRIYEIASLCGFSDINYFTKTFKRYSGVTPTYFRNHYQAYN